MQYQTRQGGMLDSPVFDLDSANLLLELETRREGVECQTRENNNQFKQLTGKRYVYTCVYLH